MAAVVVALVLAIPRVLRPTIDSKRLRTARVERGTVEAVVEGSGIVVPASERVVTAAIDSRVLAVLKEPGEAVEVGDPIVRLDTIASSLALARLEDAVLLKRSAREQLRLAQRRVASEGRAAVELKELDREVAEHRLARDVRLQREGLAAAETVKEDEVLLKRARIELVRLGEAAVSAEAESEAALAALDVEIQTLERQSAEQRRELELAETRAEAPGVVTWVAAEVGSSVRRGDAVARVADLRVFRVEGTASDVHAARLLTGLPARVVVDGATLPGRVASVHPAIENGAVRFTVDLDGPSDPRLKNSRRVVVLVVTASRAATLKVREGAVAGGMSRPAVYVVRGSSAVRIPVELGLRGFGEDEIVSGLNEGDEVVVSDLSEYHELAEVRIR